ncbi:recombinase family protein [Streptomyces bambusae]|uniref:Resolvase/invertase-type recombinase catalytic domain-containing protein n=1 Tax=Streptomyces bambusae TaxID=1550616 RepID=A0ABS6ZDR1_9ACTN|nr:recombinase family protein [Streptomyces bambusae]MBW5485912.1 hypothetical protein [Streptomyces bambusae]
MELISLGDRGQDVVRARTYGRQSHKSESDSQASPQIQRDTGIAFINSQSGWEHTGHYEDVGLSGYDPNVYRPDFERMLEDARKGEFDVLVIYMLSRLTRQGAAEALKIQQELAKYGVALVSTQEPFINTSDDNPFGVAFFALIAGLAHQESKNKSKFIRDAFAILRAKGSHSSGPVPHGFVAEETNVDGITVRQLHPGPRASESADTSEPTPADSVDFIIDEIEKGTVPNAIATALTKKRFRTPLASLDEEAAKARKEAAQKRRKRGESDNADYEWSATVVLRILRDPRLAGYAIGPVDPKTKARTILRDEEGQPVTAHTGFISPKRWYDIQQTLNGRKRERRMDRTGEMTLLGSWGILRCGRCESGLTIARAGAGAYVCNLRRAVGKEEKHVLRIGMDHTDRIVAERVWARLGALDASNPDDVEWLSVAAERFAVQGADPEAAAELAEQEAQLQHVQQSVEELSEDRDAYVGPTARKAFRETMAKYAAHEEQCAQRIDELRASAATSARLPIDEWTEAGDGNPFDPEGVWARWSVAERRSFLSLFVDAVTVAAAASKSGPAEERAERRINVEWAARPNKEEEQATG